jgi:hypothetical protein
MPARLNAWLDAAAQWGAAAPVVIAFAVALVEAVVLPRRLWSKGVWVLAVAACGVIASIEMQWQERAKLSLAGSEIAALQGLWEQWDRLSQSLPSAGEAPASSFDTVDDGLASLSAQESGIERQIAALRTQSKNRSIGDETAAKLADFLRQFSGNPVVVSCVPDDVEAYNYATQLVNILRAAGWDARGPELTEARADAAAMGISVFVRDPHSPGAAKTLLDAFTRFNIPCRSGIAASEDIPDAATVELFVAKKP